MEEVLRSNIFGEKLPLGLAKNDFISTFAIP